MDWINLEAHAARAVLAVAPQADGQLGRWVMVENGDGIGRHLAELGFRRHVQAALWMRPAYGLSVQSMLAAIPDARLWRDAPQAAVVMRLPSPPAPETFSRDAAPQPEPKPEPPVLDWEVEKAEADPIGLNDLDEPVFEHPRLGRVALSGQGPIVEGVEGGGARFLRIASPRDAANLLRALVRRATAPERPQLLTMGEWLAFAQVTRPEGMEPEAWSASLASRLVGVLRGELLSQAGGGYRQAFDFAAELERGLPVLAQLRRSFPDLGSHLRPSVLVALQRSLAQAARGDGVVELRSTRPGAYLGLFDRGVRVFASPGSREDEIEKDVSRVVAGAGRAGLLDGAPSAEDPPLAVLFEERQAAPEPVDLGGHVTNRADLRELMELLDRRRPDGFMLAVLEDTGVGERLDGDTDAFRRWLGGTYAIEGTAVLPQSLWDTQPGSRKVLLAIGERRPEPLAEPPPETWTVSMPDTVEDLWGWTSDVISTRAAIRRWHDSVGVDAVDEDTQPLQFPYRPASRAGEGTASVSRALQEPTAHALTTLSVRCAEEHGVPDVDALVARELGIPTTELGRILSPEQIDAVAMAIDAKTRGRGFLIGDQMGLGKGRVLAAMMAIALRKGQKVLFLTERAINLPDIVRDFNDIGAWGLCRPLVLNGGVTVKDNEGKVLLASETSDERTRLLSGMAWPEDRNLILGTYSQLAMSVPDDVAPEELSGAKLSSRWVRHAIDRNTFLVLDESHNVAQGTSNAAKNLGSALSRTQFVLFSSGTWARNPKAMEIYRPLLPRGVSYEAVSNLISSGGIAMQEIFSSMLAKDGLYIARQHDLSRCVFETANASAEETAGIAQAMDRLADVLAEMAVLSREADARILRYNGALANMLNERFGDNEVAFQREMARLQLQRVSMGAPLYEISRAFLASALAEPAARLGIEALERGEKPVFLFDRTMGAVLRMLKDMEGEQAPAAEEDRRPPPDFRVFLTRMAARLFRVEGNPLEAMRHLIEAPTWSAAADRLLEALKARTGDRLPPEEVPAALGEAMTRVVEDGWTGTPEALGQAAEYLDARLRAALEASDGVVRPAIWDSVEASLPMTEDRAIRRVRKLIDLLPPLPLSAIDTIKERIEAAGRERARAGVIDRPWTIGEITGRSLELRDGAVRPVEPVRRREVGEAFQGGALDAIIINAAGSTGIDLHAAEKYADTRPRVMIEVQSPADITRQIQAYGRINRLGVLHTPKVVTLATGLPIEMRLLALRNTKLRRLSATVTGSRENAGLIQSVPDLMNAIGDDVCERYFRARPHLMERMGLAAAVEAEPAAVERDEADAIGTDDRQDATRSASFYLARLAMLPVALQEQTLRELENEYRAAVDELDARGENPLKEDVLRGRVETISRDLFEGAEIDDENTTAFKAPVYLQKVRIIQRERPMTWLDIERQVEEAEADSILSGDGLTGAVTMLRQRRDAYLTAMLPPTCATVEQALAANVPVVRKLADRIDRMTALLEQMRPGASLTLMRDGEPASAIVLGVEAPDANDRYGSLFHPQSWQVSVALPGLAKPVRFSLSSLMAFEGTTIGPGLHGSERESLRMAFVLKEGREHAEDRSLLTGNMFVAQALNVTHKLGRMVNWRRPDGVMERGVLVSKRHLDLEFLPVCVTNADVVRELVHQYKDPPRAYSTPELSHHGIRVQYYPSRREFVITLPKENCRRFGHLYQYDDFTRWVQDARNGVGYAEFEEKSGFHKVSISSQRRDLDLYNSFFDILENVGHPFYFASRYRPAVNAITARLEARAAERHWIENGPPVPDETTRRVA